jgi:tetratricopeptide (TPR) repeat protein
MILVVEALAAALLAAGGAVTAQAANGGEEGVVAETNSAENLLVEFDRRFFASDFDAALAITERFDPATDEGKALVAALRASALLGLKRDKEADALIAEVERLSPQDPLAVEFLWTGGLVTNRMDVAADALDRLIARFPDVVREIPSQSMTFFLSSTRENHDKRSEDRIVALALLGYGGPVAGDYLAANAVETLVGRGDAAAATALIKYIDEPRLVEDLLIRKRFAPLWPLVAEKAGAHLEKVRSSSVAAAEQAFAENPQDPETLQLLANAFRHAGRLDEAIALRAKLPQSAEAMATVDDQTGWAINNVALALHSAGRADEADAMFAALNGAATENGGWRVSMIINRLELLVADGRFDKALPLLELTEEAAAKDGSPYAQQLVRRLQYCTYSGLGRGDKAAELLPAVIEHASDAPAATIDGLICAGEIDKAEKIALEALEEKHFEADFVRALQRHSLTADDPSVWSKGWSELRLRPAIAREFDRLGRDIPEEFLPATTLKVAAGG